MEQREPLHRMDGCGLSERGVEEALLAGRVLADKGYIFDVAYTSLLRRAIKTLWIVLEEMNLMWIPVHRSWRLNERHYGCASRTEQSRNSRAVWQGAGYDLAPKL
ncbi:MAG TPA: 2,3-bisphosphoglycerate-dependent phosphoglycerate mutase [Candidatus Binatia bacterium]|nr:2,3-bisphosphoglycerate-dependent phosphoglycerate mutase [Candidatus Binatia bacterium]